MKGYLILENGCVFEGNVQSGSQNVLGNISLEADGSIKVENHLNKSTGLAFNGHGYKTDAQSTVLSDLDLSKVIEVLKSKESLYGKIVMDSMPMEYHLYDLKTYIPCGVM